MRVKRAGVASLVHERRNAIIREWGKHRPLQRFLADHCPLEWEKIRECKTGYYQVHEDDDRKGSFRVTAKHSCHQVPWCIMCVNDERARRLGNVMKAFDRCTPAGQEGRMTHIVQVATIYDEGTGWGLHASKDLDTFFDIVHETLRSAYGEGIGWYGSYQDFGEKPFKKRHSHIDLTLNGWALEDGTAKRVPRYQLAGGGRERWEQRVLASARERWPEATGAHFDITPEKQGWPQYYGILRYQLRELMDLRKIEYSRTDEKIWWRDYKSNYRVEYDVVQFMAGIAEYQARLGQWGYEPGKELHRGYGHMAKARIKPTTKAMGGQERPHPKSCACRECGSWQRVFLDEAHDAIAATKPLPHQV